MADLGDCVAELLARFGVTEAEVSRWLGRPCGCAERREKLNALGAWAKRVAAGRAANARRWLRVIMG